LPTPIPFASEYPWITNLCEPFTVSVTDREEVGETSGFGSVILRDYDSWN
jgi:hypothetical protein